MTLCLTVCVAVVAGGCHWLLPLAPRSDGAGTGTIELGGGPPRDGGRERDRSQGDGPLPDIVVDDDWKAAAPGATVGPNLVRGVNAFASITAALGVAREGALIRVAAGVYCEAVGITKPVTLDAQAGAVLDGDCNNDGKPDVKDLIAINADGVVIRGFKIQRGEGGIYVAGRDGVTIQRNEIHDMYNPTDARGVGIILWDDCDDNLIVENTIERTDRQGVYLGTMTGTVVLERNRIIRNTIRDSGLGRMPGGPDSAAHGLQLKQARTSTVVENTLERHKHGIYVESSPQNMLAQNQLLANTQSGVMLMASPGNKVEGNDFADNQAGILILPSTAPDPTSAAGNRFCRSTGYAINNQSPVTAEANGCWWGAASGPKPTGSGEANKGLVNVGVHQTVKPTVGPCSLP